MSDTMCKIESVTYNIQCGLLVTLFLNTCTFQHVYFAICALCNMCTLLIIKCIVQYGGGAIIIPLKPLKIQNFNGFCKFCFYRGLDMYING